MKIVFEFKKKRWSDLKKIQKETEYELIKSNSLNRASTKVGQLAIGYCQLTVCSIIIHFSTLDTRYCTQFEQSIGKQANDCLVLLVSKGPNQYQKCKIQEAQSL